MRKMTRRRFLQTAAAFSVPLGLPGGVLAEGASGAAETPRVVEVVGPVEKSLEVLLRTLGGLGRFVRPGGCTYLRVATNTLRRFMLSSDEAGFSSP